MRMTVGDRLTKQQRQDIWRVITMPRGKAKPGKLASDQVLAASRRRLRKYADVGCMELRA